jgi:hypothetical protein
MNTSAWTHSGRTVGRLLGSVRCWPFLSLALVLALPALAEDEKPAPPPPRRGHIQTDLQRRVKERKRGDEAPRTHGSMRQFLDHDGSVTITNRPEKYRERKGFSEVKLSYEAVRVAPKYQKYTTAAQYSSERMPSGTGWTKSSCMP